MPLKGYIVRTFSLFIKTFTKSILFFPFFFCFKAYSFLNPNVTKKLLAAYIIGIAVGQCIIFLIVTGVIHLREWIIRRKKGAAESRY